MNTTIPPILQSIIAAKQKEVAENSQAMPISIIENMIADEIEPSRGFYDALVRKIKSTDNAVIAEIKQACPVRGIIRSNFRVADIAKSYEENGAACLSVVTDKQFFKGDEKHLEIARDTTKLPIMRKDFIIDEYQVFESCAMGADCISLMAACLDDKSLLHLIRLSYDLGMDVIVEVSNLQELDKVAGLPFRMVAINNRDYTTHKVDLTITTDLITQLPKEILVITEGEIDNREDVSLMSSIGANAFLLGENLLTADNPGEKLAELFS